MAAVAPANNFLQKGIAQIQEATALDQAQDYDGAIGKYMQGLEYFSYACKRESSCQCVAPAFAGTDAHPSRADEKNKKAQETIMAS